MSKTEVTQQPTFNANELHARTEELVFSIYDCLDCLGEANDDSVAKWNHTIETHRGLKSLDPGEAITDEDAALFLRDGEEYVAHQLVEFGKLARATMRSFKRLKHNLHQLSESLEPARKYLAMLHESIPHVGCVEGRSIAACIEIIGESLWDAYNHATHKHRSGDEKFRRKRVHFLNVLECLATIQREVDPVCSQLELMGTVLEMMDVEIECLLDNVRELKAVNVEGNSDSDGSGRYWAIWSELLKHPQADMFFEYIDRKDLNTHSTEYKTNVQGPILKDINATLRQKHDEENGEKEFREVHSNTLRAVRQFAETNGWQRT